MEYQRKNRDFGYIAVSIGRFLWAAAEEIISGILNNRVPAKICYAGLLLALVFYFRFDSWVLGSLGLKFRLDGSLRLVLTYASLISGWVLWGVARAGERNRLLNRLKDAFSAANLKCNGRFPSLIEDVRVDDYVRKLRLLCHGIPKADFEKEIRRIESVINVTVVKLHQDENDKSKIEVVYTMKDLDPNVVLENPEAFADGEIPIGHSHEGTIHINMRDVGHILVAGQTGGGKSNFLKVATTVLTLNNPESDVFFLDFKGGMESADIRNHAKNLGNNVSCINGAKRSIELLVSIGASLEPRFKALSAAGVSNLDDYRKKQIGRKGDLTEGRLEDIRRTFIIVDEIAQLYARDGEVDKALQNDARAAVNRIARQGRAAGVHLIVATQKPDASSFDQTVKSNLPGVLCFPMPNQVSSVSALGTKRAFEINPHIKGRAVWKFGPKLEEVQTYLFA
jgi:hypothetical protein